MIALCLAHLLTMSEVQSSDLSSRVKLQFFTPVKCKKKEEIIKTLKNENSHLVHALNTTKQCRSMNKQLEKLYTPMSASFMGSPWWLTQTG